MSEKDKVLLIFKAHGYYPGGCAPVVIAPGLVATDYKKYFIKEYEREE